MKIQKTTFTFYVALLFSFFQTYAFSALADNSQNLADFTVAQDGSGDFKTVQEAINAVPDFRKVPTAIFIKKGVYKEKLNLSMSKQMVRLIGEDATQTILTYDDWAKKRTGL